MINLYIDGAQNIFKDPYLLIIHRQTPNNLVGAKIKVIVSNGVHCSCRVGDQSQFEGAKKEGGTERGTKLMLLKAKRRRRQRRRDHTRDTRK
jgi:hypothetical protein